MEDSDSNDNQDIIIKINNLERKITKLENNIYNKKKEKQKDINEVEENEENNEQSKKELKQQLINKSDKSLDQQLNEQLEEYERIQKIYCHCCNFTNSNHNAVKLILEFFILFLNVITVSSICYMLIIR